ncbi:Flp family type IVb pilin [Paenibacillus montanisoli]|uniref:Flp family type IVb pilin n=1 Tax=Paenibacillus montanisoli TaxID=2081970 RepID=A0A328U151_9BACL|nr:Flp family type IVb pilin [Paenibacillus montanisoli]RAP73724.1 Flp family type IVb pilin [Paenibacillus montanisoli]
MMNKLIGLVKEEQGQGMTEYGLVLGLIAVAVVTILVALRGKIVALFENAETAVDTGVDGLTETP